MRVAGVILAFALAVLGTALPASAITLQPGQLPGMCLSIKPGGEAESQPCDGSARQEFGLPLEKPGPIRQGETCFAPDGGGNYPPLRGYACDGSPAQTWTLTDGGEMRSGAGRCLSLLGGSSRSGEVIFAADCPKQGLGHAWQPTRVAPDFANPVEGSFEFAGQPGKCLGYDAGIGLYPCTDAFRQLFSFNSKEMGQMRMMSGCLLGGFAFNSVGIGDCHSGNSARWMLMESGVLANGELKCLEVRREHDRDVLRAMECRFTPEQKWVFRAKP